MPRVDDGLTVNPDLPTPEDEIATNKNLSLAALDNQLDAERDDADMFTMTASKLAEKLPGMAHASLQLDDPTYARFREEDEALLKEKQAAWRESHPET